MSYSEALADFLGPYVQVRDTAIDEAKLNPTKMSAPVPGTAPSQRVGKVSFVANFPRYHHCDWFAQLKLLKMRDSYAPDADEVKWRWFEEVRDSLGPLVGKVHAGLGQAAIFINDLAPSLDTYQKMFTEMGFEPKLVTQHQFFRGHCLWFAAQDMMFDTPLFDLHYFNPVAINRGDVGCDWDDEGKFDPTVWLKKIGSQNHLSPQNVLQFAGEVQASFEELVDPETIRPLIDDIGQRTRYLSEGQVEAKRMLLATSANRTLDPGNGKVGSAILAARNEATRKSMEIIRFQYGNGIETDYSHYGATYTDMASHCLDELQMADLAAGYAKEIFEKSGGQVNKLRNHFRRVFFNGKPLDE